MADIIDELKGLDDNALLAKLGLSAQLDEAKKGIAAAAALEGDARTIAANRVAKMFEPHVWPGEFKHIAKSAVRQANRSGVDEMLDDDPCCVMPMDDD